MLNSLPAAVEAALRDAAILALPSRIRRTIEEAIASAVAAEADPENEDLEEEASMNCSAVGELMAEWDADWEEGETDFERIGTALDEVARVAGLPPGLFQAINKGFERSVDLDIEFHIRHHGR